MALFGIVDTRICFGRTRLDGVTPIILRLLKRRSLIPQVYKIIKGIFEENGLYALSPASLICLLGQFFEVGPRFLVCGTVYCLPLLQNHDEEGVLMPAAHTSMTCSLSTYHSLLRTRSLSSVLDMASDAFPISPCHASLWTQMADSPVVNRLSELYFCRLTVCAIKGETSFAGGVTCQQWSAMVWLMTDVVPSDAPRSGHTLSQLLAPSFARSPFRA